MPAPRIQPGLDLVLRSRERALLYRRTIQIGDQGLGPFRQPLGILMQVALKPRAPLRLNILGIGQDRRG
ncbi:hypothetical protein GALL_549920 [mine drainage metagenome]|uniref:Uncharacterized protein n=1 Tax=mine drainage metagenome TaxID=410659 RepID=A0A1J5PE11_9ZZZZ